MTYEHIDKNETCIRNYIISIEKNQVYIGYGLNGYVDKKKEAADMEAGCEYGSYWKFVFNGKKLNFIYQTAAG